MQEKIEKTKIIVITGAESTGKSDLTYKLAEYFDMPYFQEYARDYISGLDRKYNYTDVKLITEKQVEQYNYALNSNAEYFFLDTWLIITKVWFEVVFQRIPDWLEDSIKNAEIAAFFVCDTDLDWIPDGIRENGGEKREILQKRYIDIINQFKFKYFLIQGKGDQRFQNALNAMEQLSGHKSIWP